jgi:hypothetical protein
MPGLFAARENAYQATVGNQGMTIDRDDYHLSRSAQPKTLKDGYAGARRAWILRLTERMEAQIVVPIQRARVPVICSAWQKLADGCLAELACSIRIWTQRRVHQQ